ncbi:unnamed protein product [Caenorhabditis angaria]|uniref:Glycoside hydrolase 35 catalytic domain-containing protein n=1 Tax=Caenorhabditis angaria TaxID=860376 RepID=A0A9P1IX49_9PELO|nr:unnamed protein product [Caenorhabditis angaria]
MLLLLNFFLLVTFSNVAAVQPSFGIDPVNKTFLLDGQPFQYMAGEIHYFRIPHKKWDDRLKRVRSMGLNAITVPIPWNLHQFEEDDEPQFSGDMDLSKFITLAQSNNLYVILRIGPFISAEWDNGGLPWWLLRKKTLQKYRSNDTVFIQQVTQWWGHLLPKIFPHMRRNNGPVIMVQVEHLYGSLGICDKDYLDQLEALAKHHLGNDVVLFTTDYPVLQTMDCGTSKTMFATVSIEPVENPAQLVAWHNIQQAFAQGPFVASHFVIGKAKLWGINTTFPATDDEIVTTSKIAYSMNGSISYSVIHGGTSFGFWSGSVGQYPVVTSHDMGAPISENGDLTTLFMKLRFWINGLSDWAYPPTSIPINIPKTKYPDVEMMIFDSIQGFILGNDPECWISTETPRTAEYIRHGYGYMYYNATFLDCGNLYIPSFAEDAYIYLNKNFIGTLFSRFGNIHNNTMQITGCLDQPNLLEIMIDMGGRESTMYPNPSRGIMGDVYMNNATLQGWYSCEVPIIPYQLSRIEDVHKMISYPRNLTAIREGALNPNVYIGNMHLKVQPVDTYIDTTGWGKGVISINQYTIGRYWGSVGPQKTLYIPGDFLVKGTNLIMFYEFEGESGACGTGTTCNAKFSDTPIFTW